jgi:hypothetical protein
MRPVVLLLVLIAAWVTAVSILAAVPPVSRDALTHHLAVPKLYLDAGGMVELPAIRFSYYPMNLDLLYLLPLSFGNDILPKYIHFAFGLLTAGLIYLYLKRRLGTAYGLAGVLLFLSLPVIVKLSITVYVDLGLVFFSFASLYFLMRWAEARLHWKYLALSAVFCGLALGTKYNGLGVLFLHTLFVGFISARKASAAGEQAETAAAPATAPKMHPLVCLALYAGVAALVFSPWAVRNVIWKGNPVYPLYQRVFQAADPAGQPSDRPALQKDDRPRTPFYRRKFLYGESGWYAALTPVRIFFEGRDDHPQFFDGRLNPYLLVLALLALCRIRGDPPRIRFEKKLLAVFAGCYLLFVFFSIDMRIRYIAPIIVPLTLLSVYGLQRGITAIRGLPQSRGKKLISAAAGLVLAAMVFLNAVYLMQLFRQVDPLSYISGRVDRQAYITRHRPEYTVYRYANDRLEADARILAIFLGNRRYYLDREVAFSEKTLKRSVEGAASWETILQDLRGQGFSHLLIRYDIFQHWSQNIFDPQSLAHMADFFQNGTRGLVAAGGYGLYALGGGKKQPAPPQVSRAGPARDGAPPAGDRPRSPHGRDG